LQLLHHVQGPAIIDQSVPLKCLYPAMRIASMLQLLHMNSLMHMEYHGVMSACTIHVLAMSCLLLLLGLGAIDVIQTRFLIIHSTPVLYAMASAYYYAG
jgi:hypothetical protein